MTDKQTLYTSIRKIRQEEIKPHYRILLAGYFNDDEIKKENISQEKYLKQTVVKYLPELLRGYLYIKGLFYLHLIQSDSMKNINNYLSDFYKLSQKQPNVHKQIRIVYQSYQSSVQFFKGWECDYISQTGPILIETDKTQQQIADRSYEIYENIEDGAKKKKSNPSHKIANMFLLSNDDMSILICKNFMTLEEYYQIYMKDEETEKQCQNNYPLPPNIFNTMEFLQIQDYTKYA